MREASASRMATDTDPALSSLINQLNAKARDLNGTETIMKEQEVNMFIMSNKENLPEENLPHLRKKLLEMNEEEWSNISMLQFKSTMTMLMISIFLGGLGVDRFMLGQTGAGIGKLLTGGGCGIWWLIDLFNISNLTRKYNWAKLQMWI